MRQLDLRLLWAAQFLNTAALMMLVPVMPFYVEDLGVEGTGAVALWAGAALAAPALMLTVSTPLWGWVGDRIGRQWMVVRALVGLALSMVVVAVARDPAVLVAGRLLQGALGGVVEAATAFVSGESDDEDLGAMLGRSYTATASGAVVGPIAGGVLLSGGELRPFMLIVAALSGVMAVLCAIALRGRRRTRTETARTPFFRSLRDVVTTPGTRSLLGAGFLGHLAIYGLVPVFALQVRGLLEDPNDAGTWVGILQALTWTGAIAGSLWWGRRNDRLGTPSAIFRAAAVGCAASILLQVVPAGPLPLVVLRLIQGFCFAALAQSVFLHVGRHSAADARSTRVGVANSFLLAGQVAGPLLVGLALLVLSPSVTIVLLAGCATAAALLAGRTAQGAVTVAAVPQTSQTALAFPHRDVARPDPGPSGPRRPGRGVMRSGRPRPFRPSAALVGVAGVVTVGGLLVLGLRSSRTPVSASAGAAAKPVASTD